MSTGPIILLAEVVTLARALWGFAHNEIRSRYLGFLMTVMLSEAPRRKKVWRDAQSLNLKVPSTMRSPMMVLVAELKDDTQEPRSCIFVGLTHPAR